MEVVVRQSKPLEKITTADIHLRFGWSLTPRLVEIFHLDGEVLARQVLQSGITSCCQRCRIRRGVYIAVLREIAAAGSAGQCESVKFTVH